LIAGSSFPAAAADKRVVFEIQLKISFSCWKWALDCGNNHNCSEILDVRHKERDFLCFFFCLQVNHQQHLLFGREGADC
jgi:hypothetical protein